MRQAADPGPVAAAVPRGKLSAMGENSLANDLPLAFGTGSVRAWRRDDRAALLRHANNPRVARWLSLRFPHPYTTADADAWFEFLESQAEPEGWAIDIGGEAVGGIGVRRGSGEFAHSGELGYWLGEAFWGRGIMSAAARAVVPFAMARWRLSRLTAYAASDNIGSIRVLEKAGFVREGLMRARAVRDGLAQDHVVFGLVKPG